MNLYTCGPVHIQQVLWWSVGTKRINRRRKKWVISKISRWLQGCWRTKIGWIKYTFLQTFTGFEMYCNLYISAILLYLPPKGCKRLLWPWRKDWKGWTWKFWPHKLVSSAGRTSGKLNHKKCKKSYWRLSKFTNPQPVPSHEGYQRRDGIVWPDVSTGQGPIFSLLHFLFLDFHG